MRLILIGNLFVITCSFQGLDADLYKRFGFVAARPILENDELGLQARTVAERITRYVRNGCRTFVAEDGSAVAIWVGTVDKMSVDPPGLLTEGDRYRMLNADRNVIAYSVSQERHVQPSPSQTPSVPLKPLILLDRHRTLCGTGVPSAMDPIPRGSAFLAIIDDRQRGPKPNIARRLRMKGEVGSPSVVRASGDANVLAVGTPTRADGLRVTYLKVESRTLQTRAVSVPKEDPAVRTAVERRYPEHEFVPTLEALWNGRTYFMAYFRRKGDPPSKPASYVWDRKRLATTKPWAILGVSFNGRYGWLFNRETRKSWLITKR